MFLIRNHMQFTNLSKNSIYYIMSLSWKKRQALASDQKTWRGLGVDSALWTSIERNSGNVKTALTRSGNKTEGIVTGLSFFNNGYERKAIKKAKLRCIALAGTSIKTPKPTIKGKGEAYQS